MAGSPGRRRRGDRTPPRRLEASRTITQWWFTRKGLEWRIRYLPCPGEGETADASLGRALDELASQNRCTRWAHPIYEPPTAAFGGPEALTIAHTLFHEDSRHILDHLAGDGRHQRELGVLLTVSLLRAARRDWYDQGHVWDLLTRERTRPTQPSTLAETGALRRLLTADPDAGRLGVPPSWLTAFTRAGAAHFDLDRRGVPTASRPAASAMRSRSSGGSRTLTSHEHVRSDP
jgi:protein-L-isoaspartate(D-aspartate) O-methyltransferase